VDGKRKPKRIDLMALPPLDDNASPPKHRRSVASKTAHKPAHDDDAPKQLAMF
jgi:hypothetical protein